MVWKFSAGGGEDTVHSRVRFWSACAQGSGGEGFPRQSERSMFSAKISIPTPRTAPPQIVASQDQILMPVGTAITIEAKLKNWRSAGSIPVANMWWPQTM